MKSTCESRLDNHTALVNAGPIKRNVPQGFMKTSTMCGINDTIAIDNIITKPLSLCCALVKATTEMSSSYPLIVKDKKRKSL